ncbi:MAG: hypothetical protein HZC28_16315 [Spirochaetes bacterium]|nr:hypothetical protein [Spirochaetota bacterium]
MERIKEKKAAAKNKAHLTSGWSRHASTRAAQPTVKLAKSHIYEYQVNVLTIK